MYPFLFQFFCTSHFLDFLSLPKNEEKKLFKALKITIIYYPNRKFCADGWNSKSSRYYGFEIGGKLEREWGDERHGNNSDAITKQFKMKVSIVTVVI
jgi:hypothetical protein